MSTETAYLGVSFGIQGSNFSIKYNGVPNSTVPFANDDNDTEYNIKIELGIAKLFHKVLNLIKTNAELFQKEDFELLGEMLSKILFGRVDNDKDFRDFLLKLIERELASKKHECRIFLEFDHKSGVAMLPWEYILYKRRAKDDNSQRGDLKGASWYISANKKSRFHLIRRVDNKVPRNVDADRLFLLVLMNTDGNENADPPIDDRASEIEEFNATFEQLKADHPDRLVVSFHESVAIDQLTAVLQDTYNDWKEEYGDIPAYGIHYLGHSTLSSQIGKLVVKDPDTQTPTWCEDKNFATLFSSEILDIPTPAIVSFQSCDSAKIGSIGDALRGVAFEVTQIQGAPPAVVGMQNEITTAASCAFYKTFYSALLRGSDVAEAMTLGRDFLGRDFLTGAEPYSTNSFGSPVLFITTSEPIRLIKPAVLDEPLPVSEETTQTKTGPRNRYLENAGLDKKQGKLTQTETAEDNRSYLPPSSSVATQTASKGKKNIIARAPKKSNKSKK